MLHLIHFYKFNLMHFLQVWPDAILKSSKYCPFLNFCLIRISTNKPFLQVRPSAFFTCSTLCLFTSSTLCHFYMFNLLSFIQVRPYALYKFDILSLFTSLTLCLFYKFELMPYDKFDLMPVLHVRPHARAVQYFVLFYKFDLKPF